MSKTITQALAPAAAAAAAGSADLEGSMPFPVAPPPPARVAVTISLDQHVYDHFAKLADEEDRTVARYISRFLRSEVARARVREEKF